MQLRFAGCSLVSKCCRVVTFHSLGAIQAPILNRVVALESLTTTRALALARHGRRNKDPCSVAGTATARVSLDVFRNAHSRTDDQEPIVMFQLLDFGRVYQRSKTHSISIRPDFETHYAKGLLFDYL